MSATYVGKVFGPQVLAGWKGPGGGDYQGGTTPSVPVPSTTTSTPGPSTAPGQTPPAQPILNPLGGTMVTGQTQQTAKSLLGQ